MEIFVFILSGILLGGLIGWFIGNNNITNKCNKLEHELASSVTENRVRLEAADKIITDKINDLALLKEEINQVKEKLYLTNERLAASQAVNSALNDKLKNQKTEMDEMSKKFNLEFENIANKIFETKSEKFTELNKTNLKAILDPLGKNIDEFKSKVTEVYDKESKERFSLGEKVKELALLNQTISEEAKNLTKALKGEAKTQGRWGEMILEKILEMSGLRKDEEYTIEEQLTDDSGKPLRSESLDSKMRPDAIVKYPDNRNVIIDSKVSLNAFIRHIEASDPLVQQKELDDHINAVKNHIIALSNKGYDDYKKSLDFVMMFIPSEPAYIAAIKGDPDLWSFAYERRILIMSPTNLITSLKLIVDLWKREYQNRNAIAIAERGAKLYDKFVGFVDNLKDMGVYLEKAVEKYDESYKQLTTGKDNLVLQTEKLKKLGLKTKKEIKFDIEEYDSDESD